MCRLALQLLGMLGNVLGRPRHAFQGHWHALQGSRSPTSKRNPPPPTYCLISCEVKGVVYHQASIYETWRYTTPFASQLIRQQVGEFLFDVRLLRPCRSMPRSAKDLAKHAKDLAKHAEDVAKYA